MKRRALTVLFFLMGCYILIAQPTNNPIAEFYNGDEGYPAWTDEIKWSNVYNMATYNYSGCPTCAGNDYEKFKYVRDIAYAAGGGVLYYPAGTYFFSISDVPTSEGLMLKKGVVIRGEKPAADTCAILPGSDIDLISVTDHGLKNLPTRFIFDTTTLNGYLQRGIPKMWNAIGIKKGIHETGLHQVSHVGICWVDIEYGYIYFGMEASQWAPTYATSTVWLGVKSVDDWRNRVPDGTHPMDHFCGAVAINIDSCMLGKKRFVFGVHIRHGGVPNYVNRMGFPEATFKVEDGPWWFGAKISVYGSDLLVANNVVSYPTKCFKMYQISGNSSGMSDVAVGDSVIVVWDYGKGLSIDVNKNYAAWWKNRTAIQDINNSQYALNVIVQDNWVFNHSNKGYDLAGGFMIVRNNINRRRRLDQTDIYGLGLTLPIYAPNSVNGRIHKDISNDDFMARAFTVSSYQAWYHKNQWNNTGTTFDNSGEGILHQDHLNGSECWSAALTYNNGNSYTGVWNSQAIGYFMGWNKVTSNIMLEHLQYGADISVVDHYNKNALAYLGNTNESANIDSVVKDYKVWKCQEEGPYPAPGIPIVTVKDTADFVLISWTDVSNEAAYRIERKLDRPGARWNTIAYRPRQQTTGMVTFALGAESLGYVGTTDGHPLFTWDGQLRNMNPPKWHDYLKVAGDNVKYRVIAIACDDSASNAISDSVTVKVVTSANRIVAEPDHKLMIYPVPSSYMLKIQNDEIIHSVNIYSMLGDLLIRKTAVNSTFCALSLQGLAQGYYIIEVISTNKQERKVFVKQ